MVATARKSSVRVIGDYETIQRLGVTDLSTVYKARHRISGLTVALKTPGEFVVRNPVLLKRFEQEYTVCSSLHHPHLVRALESGRDGETPYIALEFVDGPSLGDRIQKEGRLPEAEAVRIVTQTAEALHYAHQHRIIHRDVKPDNILLDADGRAKLIDLGLAKDFEADLQLTKPSAGLGTPNFMAPEQFSDAQHADPRCDVYSLGATLYMALTGVLPFNGRGVGSVLKKKMSNDLVPPRKLVPVISRWIETTICRSMDVNPRGRPASCLEFIEGLRGDAPAPPPPAAVAKPSGGRKASGADRRASVRYPSAKECPCTALCTEKDARWVGQVRDVSVDGISLVMKRRFEPRTVLTLEFPAAEQSWPRRLLIRVVRVQALSSRRWLLGCVFAGRLGENEVRDLI